MEQIIKEGKKIFEQMIPKGCTLTMTISCFLNVFSLFFLIYPKKFINLDESHQAFLKLIFNTDILDGLCWFMFFLAIIYTIVQIIQNKISSEFYIFNLWYMIDTIWNGLILYISFFLFIYTIMDLNESMSIIILVFCFIAIASNFIRYIKFLFKKDESLEYVWERDRYLNFIMEKYEKKSIEDIQKRLALIQLYKDSKELYNSGLKIDFEDFKRYEKEKRNKKYDHFIEY